MKSIQAILEYSKRAANPVSLQDLFRTNKKFDPVQRIRNAQFLHEELPVRLAQRSEEIKLLPFGLANRSTVLEVRYIYEDSFMKIMESPRPENTDQDQAFTELLRGIYQQHTADVQNMAIGVLETKSEPKYGLSMEQIEVINDYMNRFFMARIGLRLLMEQHIFSQEPRKGFSGVIQSACNPYDVAKQASEDASQLCVDSVGVSPKFIFKSPDPSDTFTYIPNHIYYILMELFKNSARATVNFHGIEADLPVWFALDILSVELITRCRA